MTCPRCRAEQADDATFCGSCGFDLRAARPAPQAPGAAGEEADPWVGRIVDGRYRVLDKIGRGGMGAVYRVEHVRMGKIAAMKVMHGRLARNRELAGRFRREAEAVSRLNNIHTVQVFDFGVHEGDMYLVMEYVPGETLSALLRGSRTMEFERAARVVIQVCEALGEAHEAGVIHRDIKPENVLVMKTREGADFVKVLDFGLAQVRDAREVEVTAKGTVVGTPYYMSPEQIRAEPLDHRADLYSLGALLYRMITGSPPFTADTPVGVLTKHITEAVPPPRLRRPDLPPAADAVVLKAMARKKDERYRSAEALREDLLAALGGAVSPLPVTASAVTQAEGEIADRLSRADVEDFERDMTRSRRRRVALLLAVLVGGAGAIVGMAASERIERAPEVESEPNDTIKDATLLERGKTVAGTIGKRRSRDQSDIDFYKARVADLRHLLRAEVSAVPNVDLMIEVFDLTGQMIARIDSAPRGAGETAPNVTVGARAHYVAVSERPVAGRVPTENLSDYYKLTVWWRPLGEDDEVEPNDTKEQAMAIAPGRTVTGYAGRRDDVDFYRVEGAAGPLAATVVGPKDVDLALEWMDGGSGEVRARADEGGDGAPERIENVEPGAGPTLIVVRRKDLPPEEGLPPRPPPGLGDPYRLTVK